MRTRALPWLVTGVVPPLLVAGWFASLTVGGDMAQVLPYAVLPLILLGVVVYQCVNLNRMVLASFMGFAVLMINITFRHRTPGEPGLDWQNGYKICFWMVFLLIIIVNVKATYKYFRDPVFLSFGCFCLNNLFSTIYSPVPMVSFAGALGTLSYFGFSIIAAEILGIRLTVIAMLVTGTVYSVLNVFSPLYAPEAAWFLTDPSTQIYRFQGISGQPNSLSRQSVILLLFVIIAYQRAFISGKIAAALSVLALGLSVATEGRTAYVALGAAMVMQLRKRYLLLLGVGGALALIALLATGTFNLILAEMGRNGNADEALSLAGRTELWSFVWDQVVRHPIIGHGYNSFETFAAEHWTGVDKDIVVITHNSYLEALYSTGAIGEVFFVAPFLILIARWWSRPDFGRDVAVWAMVINGITEVEMTTTAILPAFGFFVIMAFDTKDRLDAKRPPWGGPDERDRDGWDDGVQQTHGRMA